jgi:hypothetical protein
VANIKISELSNAGALNGTEVLPIVQGNATVKTTTQNIANLLGINYTPENVANKSTDATLSLNSDTLYPSQKAIKTYVDSTVVAAITDNGNWDASSGYFPNVNAQGQPITKGDLWYISVAGTLGGNAVLPGYSIRALVNNPAQNATNWGIINVGYGFTPENVANKSTDGTLSANSDTLYPSQKAVRTYVNSISVPTPTLQQVTTAGGATTTSNIQVGQVTTTVGSSLQSSGDLLAKNIVLRPSLGSATNQLTFDSSAITGTKTYTLPNATGTVALLSSISATSPISYNNTSGVISIPQANGSTNGYLSSGDWTSFSSKQAGSTNLTSLSSLSYSSASFVKMTASGTFSLDTNTYVSSSALSSYLPLAGGTMSGNITIPNAKKIIFGSNSYLEDSGLGGLLFSQNGGSDKINLSIQPGASNNIMFPANDGTIALTSDIIITSVSGVAQNYLTKTGATNDVLTASQVYDNGTNVGIGTNSPDSSAIAQIDSTTKGFLPPRMTYAQRTVISSPAQGLMVYQTDSGGDGEGVYVKRSDGWFKLAWITG